MKIYNNGINPNLVKQLQNSKLEKSTSNENANIKGNDTFQNILSNAVDVKEKIEFSKHAKIRMMDRNINISPAQMKRIENGMVQARDKGIKDSLVLVDDLALIVNVKNNIVVTAVDESKEKIFTNIDGAVIV